MHIFKKSQQRTDMSINKLLKNMNFIQNLNSLTAFWHTEKQHKTYFTHLKQTIKGWVLCKIDFEIYIMYKAILS